jgi:hypothetical protein
MRAFAFMVAVVAGLAAGACGESISPEALGDYENPDAGWYRIETYGPAPGHGDTYRIIYANPVAHTSGTTTLGATLVKEVFDDIVTGDQHAPGSLRYVAIMRKVRGGISVEDDGGWLFSQSDLPTTPPAGVAVTCRRRSPACGSTTRSSRGSRRLRRASA